MFPKRLRIEKFSATDGTLLYGLLALPDHGRARTAVLHVHGLTGSFYGSTAIEELAAEMARRGMAFFSIQTRGSYLVEEFTKRKGRTETDFIAGAAFERFEDCVHDIGGAVRFLRSMGFSSIILEGHSTGCQKVLYYNATHPGRLVKGIVLLAPVDDSNFDIARYGTRFAALVSKARALARNSYALMPMERGFDAFIGASRFLSTADPKRDEGRVLNYLHRRMEYVERIRVPVFVAFGTEDHLMRVPGIKPQYALRKLKESCPKPVTGLVIRGADHGFHGKRKLLARRVAGWIESLLAGKG